MPSPPRGPHQGARSSQLKCVLKEKNTEKECQRDILNFSQWIQRFDQQGVCFMRVRTVLSCFCYFGLLFTATKHCLHASHFCYLMAQVDFGSFSKKNSKIVLIGSSHRCVIIRSTTPCRYSSVLVIE